MRLPPQHLPPLTATPSETALLLCFSHLRWNFVYQRPQHLLSRAVTDHRVVFFEEPIFADEHDSPRLSLSPQPCGVLVAVPLLPHGLSEREQEQLQRQLLDEFLAQQASDELIIWYYTPMALSFSAHLRPSACIYDCMDELSAFKFAPPAMRLLEQRLFERADLVFTGGHSLYQAKKHQHPNCHPFPSSVDLAHFARARKPRVAEPADQVDIPHPRVGFFGVVDERMDLDLVGQLAALRPDLHFVLIGPVVKIDPETLPRQTNVHWLGGKSYTELPEYLAGWDAAFMPFAINEATRFISPTKTPEFLAAGRPVCSTPITDVVKPYGVQGLVEVAVDAAGFSDRLDLLLSRQDSEWLARVDAFLEGTSWDETWSRMRRLIAQEVRARLDTLEGVPTSSRRSTVYV